MNYMGMVLDDPVNAPSPRYWLVWPGTMLLLAGSFAEVAANYKSIAASMIQLCEPIWTRFRKREIKYNASQLIEEPCPPNELIPVWMWFGGIILSIIFTCLIMALQFKQVRPKLRNMHWDLRRYMSGRRQTSYTQVASPSYAAFHRLLSSCQMLARMLILRLGRGRDDPRDLICLHLQLHWS